MKSPKKSKFIVDNKDLALRQATLDKNLSATRQLAKQVFNEDQYHSPMALFFDIYGNLLNVLPLNDLMSNKDALAESLKDMCANPIIGAITLVLEAWAYYAKGKKDHTATQIANGEMSISSLKDEDKKEALTITMEDIDNRSIMVNYPISRTPTKASVSKAKVFKGNVLPSNPSRFANFFGTPQERAKRATKVISNLMSLVNSNSQN